MISKVTALKLVYKDRMYKIKILHVFVYNIKEDFFIQNVPTVCTEVFNK